MSKLEVDAIEPQSGTTLTLGASGDTITVPSGATLSGTSLALAGNIGIGGATPTTSGTGITFPATASASTNANTLDDYEEGTFTPTISGASSAGTGTYTTQQGRYTKIGNMVNINVSVYTSAHTGSGQIRLTNLPFTIKNATLYYPAASFFLQDVTLNSNSYIQAVGVANTTYVEVYTFPVGGNATSALTLATDPAGQYIYSLTYEVN